MTQVALKRSHHGRPRNESEFNYDVLLQTDLPNYGIAVLRKRGVGYHDAEDIAYDAWYTTAMTWKPDGGKSIKNYYFSRLLGRLSNYREVWQREAKNEERYAEYLKNVSGMESTEPRTMRHLRIKIDTEWLLSTTNPEYATMMYEMYIIGWSKSQYVKRHNLDYECVGWRLKQSKRQLRKTWIEEHS